MAGLFFEPKAFSKEVIGALTDNIKSTPRDQSIPEPQGRAAFNAALLLQAGLRALLPVSEREGVALPKIFPNDAQELQDAQRNYADVFVSGKEATDEQREVAFKSIQLAATQFLALGYKDFAMEVRNWVKTQIPLHPEEDDSGFPNWYPSGHDDCDR